MSSLLDGVKFMQPDRLDNAKQGTKINKTNIRKLSHKLLMNHKN